MPENNIEEIRDDLSQYKALDAVAVSEGGKILISRLMTDVVNSVDQLTAYRGKSYEDLLVVCATLKANLDLLRTLSRADKNKKLAQEALSEALSE